MASSVLPSDEQRRIISSTAARLQVIACAGSGKTEAIAQRISQLLADGTPPSGIVAFTFTERAAESLKSRVRLRVEDRLGQRAAQSLGQLFLGTIHSYCFRLLQQHAPEYGNYDLLDDHRLAAFLSREYRRLGLPALASGHWNSIRTFIANAAVVDNELIPAESLDGDFATCYAKFCDALARYRLLTYGQIISLAVGALARREVYDAARAKLSHLIVDEYQDVNPAQEKLIKLLAAAPVSLCVVGDDDQAIYQWRGSDVRNIVAFQTRYRGAERLPLSTNRRSLPAIVTAANRFAESIRPRLKKEMVAGRTGPGIAPYCWSAETPADEAEAIAEHIESLGARGYRYRDIGILLRSVKTSAPPLIDTLRRRGIPFSCGGRTGLFARPEAQLLGKVYALLSKNDWRQNQYATPQPVTFQSLLAGLKQEFGLSSRGLRATRERLQQWSAEAEDAQTKANIVGDYYRLLRALEVQNWDLSDAATAARMGTLARFSELIADFEHVKCRARTVNEAGVDVHRGGNAAGTFLYRQLFSYIQFYAVGAYEEFEGEENTTGDAVDILTVHQAKGLEWPVVFVPCLSQSRFPSKNAGKRGDWLIPESAFSAAQKARYEGGDTDERRLLYVALTRARDALYLSTFRRIKRTSKPSSYLSELAGDRLLAAPLPLPPRREGDAADVKPGPSVSFSELSQYERCPHSYRLRSVLGFQPQLAQELGYGRAVHSTLRRLSELARKRKRLPTQAERDSIIEQEFFLPFANRFAFANLKSAATALINRYVDHYSEDLLRTWDTERPFELVLNAGTVKGRADVILDREAGLPDALALVDYKTSKADEVPDDTYAFQLAIYAAAARDENLNVRAAYLHHLGSKPNETARLPVPVSASETEQAATRATRLLKNLDQHSFEPRPSKATCSRCDVALVCAHGKAN